MLTYEPFEIEIRNKTPEEIEEQGEDGYIVVARFQGSTRMTSIPLDLAPLDPNEAEQAQAWLERGLIDVDYTRQFGGKLFDLVFAGDVRELFREAFQRAKGQGGLRVLLDLPLPEALAGLPWELLYDEEGGHGFLARSETAPLARHFVDLPLPNYPPEEAPLRVLVVSASPKGLPPLSTDQESKAIAAILERRRQSRRDALLWALRYASRTRSLRGFWRRLRQRQMVEIEALEHATRSKLATRILEAKESEQPFHVVHFIGHGQALAGDSALEGEESVVVLEDDQGNPDRTTASEFAELISGPSLNLAVFNACETASQRDLFKDTARAALERQIPAAIGMQIPVLDRTAIQFASEFYRAWATGEPLEAAIANARRLTGAGAGPGAAADWIIPILYMTPTRGLTLELKPPVPKTPPAVRAVRWSFATLLALLSTLALLLSVPDMARTIRTELPVIRCVYPYPMHSQPSFNVAVAGFITLDEQGRQRTTPEGKAMASYLGERLTESFKGQGLAADQIYELRLPDQLCPIKGSTPAERQANAEELAHRLGAQLVIYGVVDKQAGRTEFRPEFFVDRTGFEQSPELTGDYHLGQPLRLPENFNPRDLQFSRAISARNDALVLITTGLAYYAFDDYATARQLYQQAEATPGWLHKAGKEVIYVLLGNATGRLMAKQVRDISSEDFFRLVDESLAYYDQALSINPQSARAHLGKAAMLYVKALGDPNLANSPPDLALFDQSEQIFLQALADEDAPVTANIPVRAHTGLGQIYLARAREAGQRGDPDQVSAYRQRAYNEFRQVIQEYRRGNPDINDQASLAYANWAIIMIQDGRLNGAIPAIQNAIALASPYYQGRYSAFLGQTYQNTGQVDQAMRAYQDAIEHAEWVGDEDTIVQLDALLQAMGSQPAAP